MHRSHQHRQTDMMNKPAPSGEGHHHTEVPETASTHSTGLAQSKGFGIFIELERRVRAAETEEELCFILVNETHSLVRYRQAILWQATQKQTIRALSGLAVVEKESPFVQWLQPLLKNLSRQLSDDHATPIEQHHLTPDQIATWSEWLPSSLLWIPLNTRGRHIGALILARDTPWQAQERHLLERLSDAYGHAWHALEFSGRGLRDRLGIPRAGLLLRLVLITLIISVSLLPVHQSTLAPAEIIPHDPVIVRAPIDGVIDELMVAPNQSIQQGDPLLMLDSTRLLSRLEVASKAFEVAEAEYRQAGQQALIDPRVQASLTILKVRMEQEKAEVTYLESLLERIQIRAPRSGLAVFDHVSDWLGRPVTLGERLMLIADPEMVEIEIHLPVGDLIQLPPDARVRLFLNTSPNTPLEARLHYSAYQAVESPTGVIAYRMLAGFSDEETAPRIGLKGTVRIYGERTLLIAHLLRRPYSALRQWLGL